MTSEPDFGSLRHAEHVEHADHGSIIFSPGGPADHRVAGLFAEHGLEGSGYDWQSLVHAVLATEDPAMLDRFRFDSEASMFCAYGADPAALHAVGTIVDRLLDDPGLVTDRLRYAVEHDLID